MLIARGDPTAESGLVLAIQFDSPTEMVRGYLYGGNKPPAKAAREACRERGKPAEPKGGPDVRWGQHVETP